MATYARHYCNCGSPIKPSKRPRQWWQHVDRSLDTHPATPRLFEMRDETATTSTLHMVRS